MTHQIGALSPTAFLVFSIIKVVVIFTIWLLIVAGLTLAERRIAAFIQDRLGPNRVGPQGTLQPIADGLKNFLKEETVPAESSKAYFLLAPMLSMAPALVTFAVLPIAAPLPTRWGLVPMIIADIPVGILFVMAFASLGVYGLFMAGWSSNNKYSFLGGVRASAQMVSYEVALGLSIVPVFMLVGNVMLTKVVWIQQSGLGWWLAFPLSLSFFLFVISAFAEANRLPFDMPEAESELVAGYHAEYSSMKFAMFMLGEYAHVTTSSALMATLFWGGWDIPFWRGDNMVMTAAGVVTGAAPAWWKTVLTAGMFFAKTLTFTFVFIWVRWTVPRFRYDQIMDLGWKVMLPTALGYVTLIAVAILALQSFGVTYGSFWFGAVLTAVSVLATVVFFWLVDNNRVLRGGSAMRRDRLERRSEGASVPVPHAGAAAGQGD
ncbi:MAG: NADH-quinone oxidoreductase subunit NuoH [Gemmatimonadota bacterium]|jgi:NADH-quinone oxidoreductase subunit H